MRAAAGRGFCFAENASRRVHIESRRPLGDQRGIMALPNRVPPPDDFQRENREIEEIEGKGRSPWPIITIIATLVVLAVIVWWIVR